VDLGYIDHWGKPATSCVVVPTQPRARGVKLTASETDALAVLAELAGTSCGGVSISEWKRVGAELGRVSVNDDYKRRHEAMSRAVTGLIRKGMVRVADERAWSQQAEFSEEFTDA